MPLKPCHLTENSVVLYTVKVKSAVTPHWSAEAYSHTLLLLTENDNLKPLTRKICMRQNHRRQAVEAWGETLIMLDYHCAFERIKTESVAGCSVRFNYTVPHWSHKQWSVWRYWWCRFVIEVILACSIKVTRRQTSVILCIYRQHMIHGKIIHLTPAA